MFEEPTITLREERPHSPAAVSLIARLDADLVENYGASKIFGLKPSDIAPNALILLVAYIGEVAAGCGGLRFLPDGRAELKRIFVDRAFRGRGLGRLLLRGLEARAAEAGIQTLLLETTSAQVEAVRMYQVEGWERVPCYGEYIGSSESICFGKRVG